MRIHPECVSCLMKRVLFQSRLVECDEMMSVEDALVVFAREFNHNDRSVDIASKVHAASYRAIGQDPYRDLKLRADEVAGRFVDVAQGIVDASDDPLRTAMLVAVIGNIMDFGVSIDSPEEFVSKFDALVAEGLSLDDVDVIDGLLKNDGPVVYIFDNCGESQLDKVLIRHLKSRGKRVVGVVRDVPILNDVTPEDAVRIGLDRELDRMLTNGTFYVGFPWPDVPQDVKDEIAGACIVIAKGMGNFESLSEEPLPVPIAHIMRTKCEPVATTVGAPFNTNVVKVRMPGEVLHSPGLK